MLYTIKIIGGKHCVISEKTGDIVPGGCHDTPHEAQDHLGTLMANAGPDHKIRLTDREVTVARYVIAGMCDKEIARALIVSDTTVRTYVRRLLDKFGSASRSEVTLKMIVLGYITFGDLVSIYKETARFRPRVI